MLGYVRAHKPDLKIREYDIYKGVYCSLCKSLGRRYSPFAQLLLNYDYTVLALLRLSRLDDSPEFQNTRCPYNPTVRCMTCKKNAEIDQCADAIIITAYYKLRDNLADSSFFLRIFYYLLYPFFSLMHRRAQKNAPEIEDIIAACMAQQDAVERDAGSGIDQAAHPTANALGTLCALGIPEAQREEWYRVGYLVGRWVYIMDAADDLPDDIKSGNFNPLRARWNREGQAACVEYAQQALRLTAGTACEALQQLEIKRYQSILENIFFDGLEYSMMHTLQKQGGVHVEESI